MSVLRRPILNSELRCRISFCHWTFSVRCWMFGVSVLISDFRRLTLDEIFPQILVATVDLACRDLRRLDQCHVRREYVAIHCSLLDLVETWYLTKDDLDNSRLCPQMRARYRIYGSSSSAMASTSQRSNFPYKNVNSFWRSFTGLRTICCKRRISPDVREVAYAFSSRCVSGCWRSTPRTIDGCELCPRSF